MEIFTEPTKQYVHQPGIYITFYLQWQARVCHLYDRSHSNTYTVMIQRVEPGVEPLITGWYPGSYKSFFFKSKFDYMQALLTAHNWQKWKRVFLTCPCHEIYRSEAVGLKSCKFTWKITIFVKMWNLEQYEKLKICQ